MIEQLNLSNSALKQQNELVMLESLVSGVATLRGGLFGLTITGTAPVYVRFAATLCCTSGHAENVLKTLTRLTV